MTNKLSTAGISARCRPAAQPVDVRIVDETGSTNADLLAELPRLAAPTLLLAKTQTAGRGRAGRNWLSAPGKSLTFSLAWQFPGSVQALVGLPLAVGVIIADALAMFEVPVRLKWPNDILHEGKKLAGILIESASFGRGPQEATWAVIGLGINFAVTDTLATEVGRPVGSVPWLAELDQNMLVATLLNGLAEGMAQFERDGFAAFMQRWNTLHAYSGQAVVILDNGSVLHEGRAMGVDEIGRFLLDTGAGVTAVMAGDVSLRPKLPT